MKINYLGFVGHHFYFSDTGPRGVSEWIENLPAERRKHYVYKDMDVWVTDNDEAMRLKLEKDGQEVDHLENHPIWGRKS